MTAIEVAKKRIEESATRDFVRLLARWWNSLNTWEWPRDLPGKPEGFDELPAWVGEEKDEPTKSKAIRPIMQAISDEIGHKECLRWLHLNKLGKRDEEFEQWWAVNCEPNPAEPLIVVDVP